MTGTTPPWLPLVGSVEVVVRQVAPIAIHGDAYVDLLAAPEGEPPAAFRIPCHHFGPSPRSASASGTASLPEVGERLRLHLLMSQVDGVERVVEA